jgi:hypothetical protein
MLLAPAVQEFLTEGPDRAAFAVCDADGKVLHGETWLAGLPPATLEPEFHTEENGGVTWRIVRQRQQTVLGEVVIALADGSDPRQQWARSILFKVLLPNLVLLFAAAFAVRWAVERALKPLLDLREALERRSPRDLSSIDESASPEEVRPLVKSLNRLFGLVNAQAESQRRFIADASHQLCTPLAGLQAQVEAWAQAADAARPADGTVRVPTEQVNKLRGATRRTRRRGAAGSRWGLSSRHERSRTRPALVANPPEKTLTRGVRESIEHTFLQPCPTRSSPRNLLSRSKPRRRYASGPSPASGGCRSCRLWRPCWSSPARSASPPPRWPRGWT